MNVNRKQLGASTRFWPMLFIVLFFSGLGLIALLAILSDQSLFMESLLVEHYWIAPLCLVPLGVSIVIWSAICLRAAKDALLGDKHDW